MSDIGFKRAPVRSICLFAGIIVAVWALVATAVIAAWLH
jgi:hypothetical protein